VGNDPVNGRDPTGTQDRFDQITRRQNLGDAEANRQNRAHAEGLENAVRGVVEDAQEDPIGFGIDVGFVALDVVLGGPTGEAGLLIGARRAARATPEGLVYQRTSPQTGRCYIGRCNSDELFARRQREHDRALGTNHDYEVLERAEPGRALREAEQRHIDANGGPTNRANPDGGLENRRNEIAPRRRGE